jgi:hypothetical protein
MHHAADVNLLAVLVAAVMTFVVGGPWYSQKLFGRLWSREAGMLAPDGTMKPGKNAKHPATVFGMAYVFSVVACFALAFLLGPDPSPAFGLHHGALVGVGFVATSFGVNYQFGSRSWLMWAIDAGYHVVQFTLFGLVLGLWP